ncbi:MAG: hypothetical protein F9K29_19975 [Hyphomicrobiaceae bacterium]|nr:MAG: hypothetical protein F9K29_19975 [Hyphomicrobiaceae bacterium]
MGNSNSAGHSLNQALASLLGRYGGAIDPAAIAPDSALRLAWDTGCRALDQTIGRLAAAAGTARDQPAGIISLPAGEQLALAILDRDVLNGVAGRDGNTSCAAIFAALPVVIAEIAGAIWKDARCLHWIGDVSSLPATPGGDSATPPGFELLRLLAASEAAPPEPQVARYLRTAGLTQIAADRGGLCPVRAAGFAQTVTDALHFVWLHEIAHVVLGHVDGSRLHLGSDSMLELEMAQPIARPAERKVNRVRQALEVMADDFALRLIFSHRHGELARPRSRAGPRLDPLDRIATAVIGAAIIPLALHAAETFSGHASPVIWHPPLWFRAQRILSIEAMAYRDACDALSAAAGSRRELLTAQERFQVLTHCSAALMSLTALHPLVADWIGPMQEEERRRVGARFLEDLKAETATSPIIGGLRPKLRPAPR